MPRIQTSEEESGRVAANFQNRAVALRARRFGAGVRVVETPAQRRARVKMRVSAQKTWERDETSRQ